MGRGESRDDFPPMLEALRYATVSVTFETFVLRDAIGAQFCEALSAAAGRGVRIRIVVPGRYSDARVGRSSHANRSATSRRT